MSESQQKNTMERVALQPSWAAAGNDAQHPRVAGGEDNAALHGAREKLFKQDDNTCQFCGFRSSKYHAIYETGEQATLFSGRKQVTACNLCQLLQRYGHLKKEPVGFLAYLPELTQTEVNHVARICMCVSKEIGVRAQKLQRLYQLFRSRQAKMRVGDNVHPLTLQLLAGILKRHKLSAKHHETLARSVRFVPTVDAFEKAHHEFLIDKQREQFTANTCQQACERLLAELKTKKEQ